MKTSIISIGNSKGIRIPKVLLEESGIENEVELKAKKGEIRITPRTKSKIAFNETYLLSIPALSEWNDPEEDKAWEHLQ